MEMILPAVFGAAMEREVRFLNGEDGLGLSLVLVLDLDGFVVVAAIRPIRIPHFLFALRCACVPCCPQGDAETPIIQLGLATMILMRLWILTWDEEHLRQLTR